MIDRYLIRYFLAVVDHGTFSRAAAQVNVSQPTLSVGIAKLERLLGTSLFHRSNQRVNLTGAGTRFLVHARRIEIEFNMALQDMQAGSETPLLRVGVLRSISGEILAETTRAALAMDPAARLEIVEGSERELANHVARGRLDCALTLVARGGERFLEEKLFEEGYTLALPTGHALAGRDVLAAEALGGEAMIVRPHCEALPETSRHFTERGVRPRFAFRSTNDERVLQMVAAGLGITMLPASYAMAGVVRPRLAGFDLKRKIGLIYGMQAESLKETPPAFIACLRNVTARLS